MNIRDRSEYAKYEKAFISTFGKYGGELVVVDDDVRLLEGTWSANRTAIIRFDDEAAAMRWYESPDYQAAKQFRLNASSTNLILAKAFKFRKREA
jgi:uncharacterized protein (DUF1330 family)